MNLELDQIKEWTPPLPLTTSRGVHNYMSTPRIYGLLRYLCTIIRGSYLEVGSYRGMGLLACSEVATSVVGVDNFTGIGYRKENEAILREQIRNIENITFIRAHYKNACEDLKAKKKKFSVIFIDGPHEIGETIEQLKAVKSLLTHEGFIVVDDYNEISVFSEVKIFLAHSGFKLIFEKVHHGKSHGRWWNGIAILQRTKQSSNEEEE